MSFSIVTLFAFLAAVYLAVNRPQTGILAFFILLPFGAAAAINLPAVGNSSIIAADFVAMALIGLTLAAPLRLRTALKLISLGTPGFILMCFMAAGLLATYFGPRFFQGHLVFGISRSDVIKGVTLVELGPSSGNITQSIRLILGCLTFVCIAAIFARDKAPASALNAMMAATIVNLVLGVLDFATYSVGATASLEFIRNANYAILFDHVNSGLKRVIGGFPESSAYGYFTVGQFGFWLHYWLANGKGRRAGLMTLLTLLAILLSGSSGTYVTVMLILGVTLVMLGFKLGSSRIARRSLIALVAVICVIPLLATAGLLLFQANEGFASYLNRLLFDKLESDSGIERGSWNTHAFQTFFDTWGMGIGLGSTRTSSFAAALVSNVGVIGTGLFLAFLGLLLLGKRATSTTEEAALRIGFAAAVLSLLAAAMLTKATPDMELHFYAYAAIFYAYSAADSKRRRKRTFQPAPTSRRLGHVPEKAFASLVPAAAADPTDLQHSTNCSLPTALAASHAGMPDTKSD